MDKLDLKAEVQKKLGDGMYFNPTNDTTKVMVTYLGLIENKINDIVGVINKMRHIQSAELMRAYDALMDGAINNEH